MPKRQKLPRTEPMGAWWRLIWVLLYAPVGGVTKLRYHHLERIPRTGPAIVIVNHISHFDPFLLARFMLDAGRVPSFLAKRSIFETPVVGRVMTGLGQIPVDRGTTAAGESLAAAADALRRGRVVVLHPEGTVTRDPDGWPMSARTGAARLALLAPEAPVIPVGQWGVQDMIDLYHKKVRPFPRKRHDITVGEPVELSRFAGAAPRAETLRAISDTMMSAVRELVAELRGQPAPTGPFYRYVRNQDSP